MNTCTVLLVTWQSVQKPSLCGLLGENMQVQIRDQQLVQTSLLIKMQRGHMGPEHSKMPNPTVLPPLYHMRY